MISRLRAVWTTKGNDMNPTTRKTRACTLDEDLKDALRAHAAKYRLDDLESEILMCCETLSARYKKG